MYCVVAIKQTKYSQAASNLNMPAGKAFILYIEFFAIYYICICMYFCFRLHTHKEFVYIATKCIQSSLYSILLAETYMYGCMYI